MGCLELADQPADKGNPPRLPIMASGIYARASVRSLLPRRIPFSLQPRAARSVWTVWIARRPALAV